MALDKKSKRWFQEYMDLYKQTIFDDLVYSKLEEIKLIFQNASKTGNKILLFGNGGSAAMASHCAVDLTKNAAIKAITLNEYDLITCFANDYGFENWISQAIKFYSNPGDVVVLISSSGESRNMINASDESLNMGLTLITVSGFDKNNSLSVKGEINLWVDSLSYNIVEMTHHIWLLAVVDSIIGKSEYKA